MDGSEDERHRARAVAAYYDQLAPVYGDGAYFAARRAAALDAIATEVRGARAVLDLGCGNGAYSAALVARISPALMAGVDLSPAMLHGVRRRLGARVVLARANATALPFRRQSFDLVFMSHVLLLVGDVERCVDEVARTLRPNGLLVATVGSGGERELLHELLPQERKEFDSLFGAAGSPRVRAADDPTRATAACARVGLRAELRHAPFSVNWAAVEEWVRIRWLHIADDAVRARAEDWLARVRPRTAALTLSLTETLLLARKPAAAAGA